MVKCLKGKAGRTKTGFILDAIDEKLGLTGNREELIRKTAGHLTQEEASELRENLKVFEEIHEDEWK